MEVMEKSTSFSLVDLGKNWQRKPLVRRISKLKSWEWFR